MAGGIRTGTKAAGGRVTSPFTLVEAKLSVPIPRAGLIARTELVDRLLASRATHLVWVAAPPGYGKTTLLGQWAEQDERPVAWLSVDDGDNDLSVLLTYIAVALDRAGPLGLAISTMTRPGPTGAAALLGAAMLRADTPFLLVLDDAHRLHDPSCLDALAMLIDHVPAGSQIVVAGRSIPGLPTARLRAEGRLLEVGTADLALRADEAIRLFRATGVRVPDVDVRAIVERTEGWAAGLYLAALSARSGRGVSAEEPFTGGDVLVADYLRSELLADLPARDLRFMTRTSVLERLSGSLCDAVTGSRGSAETLDRLERSNLLLVPLDRHREWFRYHNLLRDLLALELERREPGRKQELLRRAAEWHRANGPPEAAVEYALAAGDDGLAADLIRPLTLPMFRSGRAATLERWFGWFDARDLMETHPLIAVLRAWLLTLAGDAAGAERSLSVAERALAQGSTEGASRSAAPLVACLRATRGREGVAKMLEDAEGAVMSLPPDDPWHPTALLALGIARRLGGEPDGGTTLARAIDAAAPVGAVPGASVALCELGIAAATAGEWGEAERLLDRARAMIGDAGIEWYATSFLTYALGSRLAARRGDGRTAGEDLARSQRLRATMEHGVPWLAVEGRLQLVHAYLLLSDPHAARMLLREIREIRRRCAGLGVLDAEAEDLERRVAAVPGAGTGTTTLTTAEVRILAYLPTHLSFREIGERLFISRNTVKTHALSIYRKLGASSRSDAVRRAQEVGLIEG